MVGLSPQRRRPGHFELCDPGFAAVIAGRQLALKPALVVNTVRLDPHAVQRPILALQLQFQCPLPKQRQRRSGLADKALDIRCPDRRFAQESCRRQRPQSWRDDDTGVVQSLLAGQFDTSHYIS